MKEGNDHMTNNTTDPHKDAEQRGGGAGGTGAGRRGGEEAGLCLGKNAATMAE